jgi:hypothetical protein
LGNDQEEDGGWYCLSGACLSGIIFSLAVVMQYPPVSNSFVSDLYFGRIENLQFRGGLADAKMWLYLTLVISIVLCCPVVCPFCFKFITPA